MWRFIVLQMLAHVISLKHHNNFMWNCPRNLDFKAIKWLPQDTRWARRDQNIDLPALNSELSPDSTTTSSKTKRRYPSDFYLMENYDQYVQYQEQNLHCDISDKIMA